MTLINNKIQILILCGGEGTRIKHITHEVPKCMYSIGGGPFLFYTLRHYAKYPNLVHSFVLCCSDKIEDIKAEMIKFLRQDGVFKGTEFEDVEEVSFDDFYYENLPIFWATEPKPFGTLSAMVSALPFLRTEYVLVINGDTYCEVELDKLLTTSYNDFIITALQHNDVDSGIWLVRSELLKALGDNPSILNRSYKREILLESNKDISVIEGPSFIDMGTPDGLQQAKRTLKR